MPKEKKAHTQRGTPSSLAQQFFDNPASFESVDAWIEAVKNGKYEPRDFSYAFNEVIRNYVKGDYEIARLCHASFGDRALDKAAYFVLMLRPLNDYSDKDFELLRICNEKGILVEKWNLFHFSDAEPASLARFLEVLASSFPAPAARHTHSLALRILASRRNPINPELVDSLFKSLPLLNPLELCIQQSRGQIIAYSKAFSNIDLAFIFCKAPTFVARFNAHPPQISWDVFSTMIGFTQPVHFRWNDGKSVIELSHEASKILKEQLNFLY